jgi:membrane protein
VRFRAAGIAGSVAGVGWQAASVVFASFVARATNYNAIYSGFAIVIFVLIWVYVGWLIVLLGCRLAFYLQNPRQLLAHRKPLTGSRELEAMAIEVLAVVGRRFLHAQPAPTRRDVQRDLGLPDQMVERAVAILIANGILAESGDQNRLLPARDLETLTIAELWRKVRGDWPMVLESGPLAASVQQLLRGLEQRDDEWMRRNVRDWLTTL